MEKEVHPADEEAAAAAEGEEAARVAGGAGDHRPPGAALPRGTAGPGREGLCGSVKKGRLSSCGVCVYGAGRRRRDGVCVWVLGRAGGGAVGRRCAGWHCSVAGRGLLLSPRGDDALFFFSRQRRRGQ